MSEAKTIPQDVTTTEEPVTSTIIGTINRIRIAGKNMVLSEAKQLDRLELSPFDPGTLYSPRILGRIRLPYNGFEKWVCIGINANNPVLISFNHSERWREAYRVFAKYAENCCKDIEKNENAIDELLNMYIEIDNRIVGNTQEDVLISLSHKLWDINLRSPNKLATDCINTFNRYRNEYFPNMKEITAEDVLYFPYLWAQGDNYEDLSQVPANWDQFNKLKTTAIHAPLIIFGGR